MEEYDKVLDRLQSLCSKRECCGTDIYKKALKALDGDGAAAASLVESLVEDGFLSDSRYASAFAREKSRLTGWGQVKIGFALRAKGISKDVIDKALADLDPEEASKRMRTVIEAKHRLLKDDPYRKFKLLKFGLTRGYHYDDLAPVVDAVLSEEEAG